MICAGFTEFAATKSPEYASLIKWLLLLRNYCYRHRILPNSIFVSSRSMFLFTHRNGKGKWNSPTVNAINADKNPLAVLRPSGIIADKFLPFIAGVIPPLQKEINLKRTFNVELDLKSLIKISATIGFLGGFISGLILFVISVFGNPDITALFSILAAPAFSTINSILIAILGYPLYKKWCFKLKGQQLSGYFVENSNKGV